ncbi:amino acid permease [Anabaena sphaerica FACHB-251]|uniref:histidine kinase n=1 Tax=Anabaena sphaerica FACHB-251 TaxID=2692883 RepID=A0A926WGI2_9NOST|nr:ATP-binding protein [Anabaena sphaerica]MBD2292708.1 amino acid permease [Anabaena sphaerica FACHB-251]
MSRTHSPVSHQFAFQSLPRSMTTLETWTFGVTNHLSWPTLAATVHADLGTAAIFVWIPAVIVGMLVNYQVKHLGRNLLNVSGGTPNYITRLWPQYPIIARYAAIGYLISWLSVVPLNSVILTDIIKANLDVLDIACPEAILKLGFTLLPFIVAFSGSRALGILHLLFSLPALFLLLLFCFQGLGFLAFAPSSPSFFPQHWTSLSFIDWAKWFFFISYTAYSCETVSSFVADSRHPQKTLKFLDIAAWLMIPIFIGGSWVMIRLSTIEGLEDNTYLTFAVASVSFWGDFAPASITFLLASCCLLGSATTVANCPRIIYQLAVDKHLAPVFSLVSSRGVFGSSLFLSLCICMIYFIWGDISRIVIVGNVAWFVAFMFMHLGLWQKRKQPDILFPKLSLGFFIIETVILSVTAYAWGWPDFLAGLLAPLVVLMIDALVRYLPIPVFRPHWWIKLYQSQRRNFFKDSLAVQVGILIFLLCGAFLVGCLFVWLLNVSFITTSKNLLVILLITISFVGVAIACWTSLPQVVALEEAREASEHLFMVAQEGILVLDEKGIIQQANPATESVFAVNPLTLLGKHLNKFLTKLNAYPETWDKRSEHTLIQNSNAITLEVSISDRTQQNFQEYVVILHDITQRKKAEEILRQSEAQLRQEAEELAAQLVQIEKMSSLGQLVAGIAHEINNPVSFIYGNIHPANQYIQDLIRLIQLYQQHYPQPVTEIQNEIETIDLNFVLTDLPKLLNSMEVGSRRIKEIVLSLRNFSRLDEAEMKAVNIHEGIDNTLMILQNRFKATSDRPAIEVIKEYGKLPLVECYAGQLNQVFMNILANGIDALEESIAKGKEIEEPQIQIHTQITINEQVIISIKDNASGIPEHIQKHLFEPFFTTKPVGKGTGLGLSISYQIITEKHGGNLKCVSYPEMGTEFVIAIPLKQQNLPPQ